MIFRRSKRMSAMLTPNGIHLVEYRRGTRGLQILRYTSEVTSADTTAMALDNLVRMVEASGGRGGKLSVAVSGLGSAHQILSLPRADREILRPVVERELRRFYPTAFSDSTETIVDFSTIEPGPGSFENDETQELLATAIPRSLVDGLVRRLESRNVQLEHLTILPRTIERLYETFSSSDRTSALVLLIPRAPLLGFFHENRLRLFSEPVVHDSQSPTGSVEVIEHVQRGALYLRQQFRGAVVERLLVAAPPGGTTLLEETVDIPVQRFEAYGDAPGALAALGAALDADDEFGFNLLPPELRQPTAAERWIRYAMAIGSALLIIAGTWWTADALARESRARALAEAADQSVAAAQSAFSPAVPVLEERRAHAARVALADSLTDGKTQLLEVLYPLDAASDEIRIAQLTITNSGSGWAGTLRGRTDTATSQQASAAVQRLIGGLRSGLSATEVSLTTFGYADPESSSQLMTSSNRVAVDFEISFIVVGGGGG